MSGTAAPVTFDKFSAFIKTPFWFELKKRKINDYKLSDAEVPVWGVYSTPRGAGDAGKMELNKESFDTTYHAGPLECLVQGALLNYNTIEEYKKMDHMGVLREKAELLWDSIQSKRWLQSPTDLLRFYMYSFSDLKTFVFRGRGMLPVLKPNTAITMSKMEPAGGVAVRVKELLDVKRGISGGSAEKGFENTPYFVVERSGDTVVGVSLLSSLRDTDGPLLSSGEKLIGYYDQCTHPSRLGWSCRNLLVAISHTFSLDTIPLLSYREQVGDPTPSKLVLCHVSPPPAAPYTEWAAPVGWEDSRTPANLSKVMDSTLLAEESANLNLSLMKWRMLPNLDLEHIAKQKCLLVGSGTLGCGVARNLMKWGVFNLTLIDRGNVSYSNTVRQSLFVHDDAVQGKNKAKAAADACKRIYPLCNAKSVDMSVPMPGHIVDGPQIEKVKETCAEFEQLIEEHDVIFLLTDSRESRWLPSMLGAKHKKLVINAALGFESYLAMRHGARGGKGPMLGCYFCNDITAPRDSLSDRTLDQQCTVTRPGVSDLASALAVELMVSTVSHPDGPHAQPTGVAEETSGVLGTVPHQIRGGLHGFTQTLIRGEAFPQCTACGEAVIAAYEAEGFAFLLRVLNDPSALSSVSGIDDLLRHDEELDIESFSDDED